MKYVVLVTGPSGSGKTTFSVNLKNYFNAFFINNTLVNLDPANVNDDIISKYNINILEFITLNDVMENLGLGPNGGLIYCFETLLHNIDWLLNKLNDLEDNSIIIIDLPGQIELFINPNFIPKLISQLNIFNVTSICLFDSTYCLDSNKFLSCGVYSLLNNINLEVCNLNILSKIDLLKDNYDSLKYNIEKYLCNNSDFEDIIINSDDSDINKKLKLNLCKVFNNYQLVNYLPLDAFDKVSLSKIIIQILSKNNYLQYLSTNNTPSFNEILELSEKQTNFEIFIEEKEEYEYNKLLNNFND